MALAHEGRERGGHDDGRDLGFWGLGLGFRAEGFRGSGLSLGFWGLGLRFLFFGRLRFAGFGFLQLLGFLVNL